MLLRLTVVIALLAFAAEVQSRSVTVDVKAPWQRHPLSFIAEIAEFVHDHSPIAFFKYADSICHHKSKVSASLSWNQSMDNDAVAESLAELHALALEETNAFIPVSMQTLMSTMINLGHYLPALQFYQTLATVDSARAAEQCGSSVDSFAVLSPGGRIVCSASDVATHLSESNVRSVDDSDVTSAEWEHLYSVEEGALASSATAGHAVLYGIVGSPAFCDLHAALASAVQSATIAKYAVRHFFPAPSASSAAPSTSTSTSLQGYGVLLDIKNMEYKNVDDAATTGQNVDATVVDHSAADWDTLGLNFTSLFAHVPASAHPGPGQDAVVAMLREQLTQALGADAVAAEGSTTMKVWKMHDLGLQALQLVRTAATQGTASSAMARLAQIVHNFPQMASMVSATKVSAALREEVQTWTGTFGGHMAVLPPNSLLVNGRRTDLSAATFNIYNLLQEIREEIAVTSRLAAVALPAPVREQVQRIATTVGAPSAVNPAKQVKQVRIDVSKGGKHVVQFLNNLEKDPQYQHLPRQLKQLLRPAWSLTALSRNLYTLIVVVDPLSQEGAGMLMQMYMMLQQQYPVRCGVVFSCSRSGGGVGADGPSPQEDFCRMFAQIRASHSMEYATSFALSLAQSLLEGAVQAVDREHLKTVYIGTVEAMAAADGEDSWLGSSNTNPATVAAAKKAAAAEVEAVFPATQDSRTPREQLLHWDFVSNSTAYLAARNLPLNSYSLNGIVVGGDGASGGANLGGTIMQHLGREQQHVTSLYQRKIITDKTKSLFSAILSASNAYSRYHPMLDETSPDYVDLPADLLQALSWAEPRVLTTVPEVSSSTVLVAPLTPVGLRSAAVALQWSVAANSAATTSSSASAKTPIGDGEAEEVPPAMQRVGVVWELAQQPAVQAVSTCAMEDASSPACFNVPAAAAEDEEKKWQNQRGIVATLTRLQEALSVTLDAGVRHCDVACTTLMAKAYRIAADRLNGPAASLSVDAVRPPLLEFLAGPGAALLPEERASAAKKALHGLSESSEVDVAVVSGSARVMARLANSAIGARETDTAFIVIHNGRKLTVAAPAPIGADESAETADGALLEEDIVLLSTLEAGRLSDSLLPVVRTLLLSRSAAASSSPVDALLTARAHSDLLHQLAAYCGGYNSATQKHRFDVASALEQVAQLQDGLASSRGAGAGSAMVYTVEPPLSAFASPSAADIQICITMDPLTLAGQRAAALIPLLTEQLQFTVTVILVPRLEITDFPLQNFYRYVTAVGNADSSDDSQPAARFLSLPRQHMLTVRMDVPEPWNVQTASALQDTDNLRCSPGQCGDPHAARPEHTAVTYALKNLLVAGQCFEGPSISAASSRYAMPPNGLQLTLTSAHVYSAGDKSKVEYSDTLVMQNLGYFQLQANPGLFELGTAQGRASDLYALHREQAGVAGGVLRVAVRTFEDVVRRLLVHKRPGMEHVSLLGEDQDQEGGSADKTGDSVGGMVRGPRARQEMKKRRVLDAAKAEKGAKKGLFSSLSSSLFGSSAPAPTATTETASTEGEAEAASQQLVHQQEPEDDTIHVFSLATGHMYERLLRIMMLSVSRHTSKPVKFWLFENYLSPTFKAAAAVMAAEYGFEVAYVTYKWPQWLTQQTQQQRIIWGYKILFLDVLFPLNVKKVIYVDADQVVRADLAELWDLDLQGHAYAYTPFCTSREETLGFQFWQQGYWKDHLRGRPYHISALYVVDLQHFRRNAVGDTLRATYDQLSRDPNSLANLDQDLPNYAQHQVPIFSLPQEWLWCESWCSDDSKSAAKTIDLCNNPLHKEPKLDMARRVISGELFNQSWVQLDEEIRALQVRKGLVLSQ